MPSCGTGHSKLSASSRLYSVNQYDMVDVRAIIPLNPTPQQQHCHSLQTVMAHDAGSARLGWLCLARQLQALQLKLPVRQPPCPVPARSAKQSLLPPAQSRHRRRARNAELRMQLLKAQQPMRLHLRLQEQGVPEGVGPPDPLLEGQLPHLSKGTGWAVPLRQACM